jgi:hypothetical protein
MAISAQEEELVVKPPSKYKKDTKWKNFKEGAIAYLNAIKGKYDIPLAYVIREDEQPVSNQIFQSEHHRLIAVIPLQGIEFEEDNGRVFDLLKSWTINGHAWTWVRSFNSTRNGRQAWLALVNHFEGDAQRDKVKDHAYAAIAAAKYYGENMRFTFETYVMIHQDAYADLVQYGKVISEEKHVRDLLSNIKDNSAAANAAKGTILVTPTLRKNFSNAVAHLSMTLQLGHSLRENNRNISSTNTNKGDGCGGGRGKNGRGRGRGRNIYLGSYSPEQWRKLSAEDKKRVYDGRQKSAEQRSQASNKNQGSKQVTATAADGQSTIAALSTGDNTAQMDQAILHGALQGSAAVGEKRSNTDTAGSQMSRRRTSAIYTSNRVKDRNISRTAYQRHYDHTTTILGRCELDSHVDTCVAGENCIILGYTNQTVNVSAFSDMHKPLENVPIVTAANAYDNQDTGDTIILIMGQAIYMGKDMPNTLICPNQLRRNGITVDECPKHLAPINKPSTHSIICPDDNLEIPLSLQGVTSYFITCTPTIHEMETCKWIHLTDEHFWDPHSEAFMKEEQKYDDRQEYIRPIDARQIFCATSNQTFKFDTEMINLSSAFDD